MRGATRHEETLRKPTKRPQRRIHFVDLPIKSLNVVVYDELNRACIEVWETR